MERKIDEPLSPSESETENDTEISANLTKAREREGGRARDGGFAFVSADDDDAKKDESGRH